MNATELGSLRTVARTIPAVDSQDGAGVKLKRSVGRNPGTRLDPFLMLDAFSTDNPDDYIAGFPAHPHRGFETVTYMLDGHMIHRDHMGNEGELFSGGVQWMTAGRGVIHEERPLPVEGLMRGFQLWINLPAAEKMKPAAYQNIEPESIPKFDLENGVIIKLIAGSITIEGLQMEGPISVESTQPLYLDIQLAPYSETVIPLPISHNAFVYLFEGEVSIGHELLSSHNACVLSDGSGVALYTQEKSARMLLLAGKPLGEPVAQYGPFVMNTMEEVEQAIDDYRHNRLVG